MERIFLVVMLILGEIIPCCVVMGTGQQKGGK